MTLSPPNTPIKGAHLKPTAADEKNSRANRHSMQKAGKKENPVFFGQM